MTHSEVTEEIISTQVSPGSKENEYTASKWTFYVSFFRRSMVLESWLSLAPHRRQCDSKWEQQEAVQDHRGRCTCPR